MQENLKYYLFNVCIETNVDVGDFIEPPKIPNPSDLTDVRKAATIVGDIILNTESIIVLNFDGDADGILSGALNHDYLINGLGVSSKRIRLIGNSRVFGNGFNDKAVSLLSLFKESDLELGIMITSDHGSSDEPRYKYTKQMIPEMKIVVTDHHLIPTNGNAPKSVDAFINTQRDEITPWGKNICGCVTTWLLMEEVKNYLIEKDYKKINYDAIENVKPMLAISTICDMMDMRDIINRRIVIDGLEVLNKSKDPRWRTFRKKLKLKEISSTDVGYKIGTLFNATGRMGVPDLGFTLATTNDNMEECGELFEIVVNCNNERKKIQALLLIDAKKYVKENPLTHCNIALIKTALEFEYATGVSGPISSNLLELRKKPSVTLVEDKDGNLKGSVRSVEGIHVKKIFDNMDRVKPDLFIKYGGHAGAAGLEIRKKDLEYFRTAFDEGCGIAFKFRGRVSMDSSIIKVLPRDLNVNLIDDIKMLEPFGRMFKQPEVCFNCTVTGKHTVSNGRDVIYTFEDFADKSVGKLQGYHYLGGMEATSTYEYVEVIATIGIKSYRGKEQLSIFIKSIKEDIPF